MRCCSWGSAHLGTPLTMAFHHGNAPSDLIRTSICYKYSGAMKIAAYLNYATLCKKACGTNWSNRSIYQAFFMNTRRDQIGPVQSTPSNP